jgi:hypothetical protein
MHSLLDIVAMLQSVIARLEVQAFDRPVPEVEKEYLRGIARRLHETGAVFVVDRSALMVAGAPSRKATVNVSDRDG